jgi:hypothetical protein
VNRESVLHVIPNDEDRMQIKLPDLPEAACRFFLACGHIPRADKASTRWLSKHKGVKIAKTTVHRHSVYVRNIIEVEATGKHFHIDIATRDYFGGRSLRTTARWSEIQRVFEPIVGTELVVEAEGVYVIPIDKLPPVIKAASALDTVEGGVSIKMTGGRFSVFGAPVYAITWRFGEEDETALVRLEARIETAISEDYLLSAFDLLRIGLTSFIESGVPRGEESNVP